MALIIDIYEKKQTAKSMPATILSNFCSVTAFEIEKLIKNYKEPDNDHFSFFIIIYANIIHRYDFIFALIVNINEWQIV